MDKKEVHNAAVATTAQSEAQLSTKGQGDGFENEVGIVLTINARDRACLIHEGAFPATPVWVKYLTDKRKIKIIYDNGTEKIINYIMDDKLHKKLLNITKLFLIRTDNGKPVEGYDTTLLKE